MNIRFSADGFRIRLEPEELQRLIREGGIREEHLLPGGGALEWNLVLDEAEAFRASREDTRFRFVIPKTAAKALLEKAEAGEAKRNLQMKLSDSNFSLLLEVDFFATRKKPPDKKSDAVRQACSLAHEDRFARQITLPEVGAQGQDALARARVLVIGCGGLAAPVCTYLVAAGVGVIGLVDDDRVEVSNLQRQTLFEERDLGKLKVEAAKIRLEGIRKETLIQVFPVRFNPTNAIEIASQFDVIMDCTDNFAAKYLANDVALNLDMPLIIGAITGFDGQFGVFAGGRGPCYRCLYPRPPVSAVRNCQEAGVLGASVGIVGSWQALECLKVLLDQGGCGSAAPNYGKFFALNLRTAEQFGFAIKQRSKCVCTEKLKSLPPAGQSITWEEIVAIPGAGFLDVREDGEATRDRFLDGEHWPLSKIESEEIPDFLTQKTAWILYCKKGHRSQIAADLLAARFPDVLFYSLLGGIEVNAKFSQSL